VANNGGNLQQVVEEVKQALPLSHIVGLFDTLKYLQLGGRIGKAQALVGSVLNVKPLITLKDGEVVPAGQVRSRAKGIEWLVETARKAHNIQDLAVAYTLNEEEAKMVAEKIDPNFQQKPHPHCPCRYHPRHTRRPGLAGGSVPRRKIKNISFPPFS